MLKPTLWVFWLGQFMRFFTPHLLLYFDIQIYDKWEKNREDILSLGVSPVGMQKAAECDYVLLGYPAKYIEQLVQDIAGYIKKNTVVFDICSVKTPVVKAMLKYLPEHCHIITTHPIFGPQSWQNGIKWLKLTISNVRASEEKYDFLKNMFWKNMWLKVFEMTPEEHDREMAYIQGITHFIGRSLKRIGIPDAQLATCSYNDLRNSSETGGYDSDDLFLSIQTDNPYAWEVRQSLLQEFEKQNTWIEDNSN